MEDRAQTTPAASRRVADSSSRRPADFVLPAILLLLSEQPGLRLQPREGSPRVPVRPHRPPDRLPRPWPNSRPTASSSRGRRPRPPARPAGCTASLRSVSVCCGLDERDQGGARLPRPRPAPLPGHRYRRRGAGRGRGRVGGGAGLRRGRRCRPRSPAAAATLAPSSPIGVAGASRSPRSGALDGPTAATVAATPGASASCPTDRSSSSRCARPWARSASARSASAASVEADVADGGDPHRHASPRPTSRSRSTGCARATASTTPSCCAASTPAGSRTAAIDLRDCVPSGSENRYRLAGGLTFHGVTRPVDGTVSVDVASDRRLVVTGEQVFDIRDFDVPSPTVLMLRIYPDVRVRLHVEADARGGC